MDKILFFDIETQANPEALELAPEPKAPGNLKDPLKIAAAIEEKKRDLVDSAALDPDYGKVLSIGWSINDGYTVDVRIVDDVISAELSQDRETWIESRISEESLIKSFWDVFSECRGCCVGYNILSFDLPFLMARSMYLGVRVPLLPNLQKYRTEPIRDLYAIRYNWGPGKGLKQACKLLGIENKLEGVDGSMVKDMDRSQLRQYQENDLRLLIALYHKMDGVYF